MFPNLNFVFASICAARPVHIQSDQYRSYSTVNNVTTRSARGATPGIHPDGEQPKKALWLWVREITWYLYTRGVRARMKQNNVDLKLLEKCVMNGFIIFASSCSWRPLDWRISNNHLASTLFHSLVPWWRPRIIRPQITRLSQLENSAMGTWPIYKNSITPEKWRDIKFWFMC